MFYFGSDCSSNVSNGGGAQGKGGKDGGKDGDKDGGGGDKPKVEFNNLPICPCHLCPVNEAEDDDDGKDKDKDKATDNDGQEGDQKSYREQKEEAFYRHMAEIGPDGLDKDGDRMVIRNCDICGYPILYKIL